MTIRAWSFAVAIALLAAARADARPRLPVRPGGSPRPAQPVPQPDVTVLRIHVPLYADPDCTRPLHGVQGVVFDDQGHRAIFPSTRDHFHAGDHVSWEWNMRASWGPTWYRDPDTHRISQAWLSSAEFIGRPLPPRSRLAH